VFDMPAQEAVGAARIHHQWRPDELEFEEAYADPVVKAALAELGHVIGSRKYVGVVQLLHVRDGLIEAACDPRKGGRPAGF